MSLIFRRLPSQLARAPPTPPQRIIPSRRCLSIDTYSTRPLSRSFSTSPCHRDEYEEKAKKLSQKGLDEQESDVRRNQLKRPWHREDADKPPADEKRGGDEPLTKGKLLTTPTRLLKLILPLPISLEKNSDNNGHEYGRSVSASNTIQPLALLIHPQQPLSYVERLIQAEIPPVLEDGKEKIPNIYFRAEDTDRDDNRPTSKSDASSKDNRKETSPTHVASYSGLGHEGPERKGAEKNWVRWSSSTEIGDFIRDAARGREFAIEIEGHHIEMRVSVPSFNDRTYYMRVRLRRMSKELEKLSLIKHECDLLAHRSAHRIAKGGFGLLTAWWGVVYYVSFHTESGWDLVEPVTYLAGLTTIMGGYLWFLYISRDLSYKAAMNVTVSRRQSALYEARGFDIGKWEQLVKEANALRSEIGVIAVEYDVDWDAAKDTGEEVKDLLDEEKSKKAKSRAAEKEEDESLAEEERSKDKDKDKAKDGEGKGKDEKSS
ncbi:hypothetical protein B0T25DRAFT_461364 [Lasiosphaeria hispida]|uniref:Calcium uniporter protein n=1 Tax=Lasiosphaeria hispida TaxID=260671 RepID=A0AAJ0HCE1_9PEZI|nr:hypothetical protein B0T25DRAFT_461364 [Lasiosphaeria hispida]